MASDKQILALLDDKPISKKTPQDVDTLTKDEAKQFLKFAIKLKSLSKIKMEDAVAVKDRTAEYFKLCDSAGLRPTRSGYALALGCTTTKIDWIVNNKSMVDTKTAEIVKDAMQVLEMVWETCMIEGKINPVSGIFIAKNQFGYVDSKEVVVAPKEEAKGINEDEFQKKYLEDNYIDVDGDTGEQ